MRYVRHPPSQTGLRRARTLAAGGLVLLAIGTSGPSAAQPDAGRLRPPPAVDCPRDHLTVHAGQVLYYRRGPGRSELRIRTDEATTETVRIRHPGTDDPGPWFLLAQQPFEAADWPRIEDRPGHLRSGLRAAAWVCDDGRNPVVDWTLPRQP